MQGNEAHNVRARRGTKSCTDCRRRKVRCIRASEDALACRRCEERGLECIPQESRPSASRRVSSRQRISQLESQVSSLTKIVRRIESKLGPQADSALEIASSSQSPGMDSSDDESNMSGILATERPSHLQSLFQNDWLFLDDPPEYDQIQVHRDRSAANLLDAARDALQMLIPPKYEVAEMYKSAFEWLRIIHALLPQPFIAQSQADALENYDRMKEPHVDTMTLASWMLTLAMTAQQTPRDNSPTSEQPGKWFKRFKLSRAISDTVESTIISHDRLLGTLTGVMICMHWTRLQLPQGNFQKAWIRLRHISAIAELMGLPKASQAFQHKEIPATNDEVQLRKAQLWEMISTADKLMGMILNLPPEKRFHRNSKKEALTVDGLVQPRLYFTNLVNIAGKVQALDEMNTTCRNITDLSKATFELIEELRSLASQTPESWWTQSTERIEPDNIVQAIHYYLLLRVYMPLTLRQDPSEEHFNTQLACFKTCESVIQRNTLLLEVVPPGFFLYTMMELHTFTATVVLILLSNTSKISQQLSLYIDRARTKTEVEQVIAIMRKRINNTPTSRITERAVNTLSSLANFLQDKENVEEGQKLKLDVPLLGKVHIQRSCRTISIQTMETCEPLRTSSGFALGITSQEPLCPAPGLNFALSSGQGLHEWGDLSWFIEEGPAYSLQDTLIPDTFDQHALLYQADHNFPSDT